jgi:hypothetical protein
VTPLVKHRKKREISWIFVAYYALAEKQAELAKQILPAEVSTLRMYLTENAGRFTIRR